MPLQLDVWVVAGRGFCSSIRTLVVLAERYPKRERRATTFSVRSLLIPTRIIVDQWIRLGQVSRSSPSQPREPRVPPQTQGYLYALISPRFRPPMMAEPQRNRPSNQWVHTVRAGMASDTSRAWFDAKVQEHGFDFLDDYLDRILAQAKQPQSVLALCSSYRIAHIG